MARPPNLATRARILAAAQRLIHAQGFAAVSMDDIASAAGLKKANLFHYYPTREALACAVLDHATSAMAPTIASLLGDGANPIMAIERLFIQGEAWMRESSCSSGCLIGNLAQEVSDQHEELRVRVARFLEFWGGEIAGVLARGRTSGFFNRQLRPRPAAHALLALFEGAMTTSKALKDAAPLVHARHFAVTYLRGFTATAPSPRETAAGPR
jgi:TetR/AcrR family transcriptional repressor of nem operon